MKRVVQKKRAPTKKIVGYRNQWTADVEGTELGVLHNTWRVGTTGYFDPMEAKDGPKHKRLTDALIGNEVAVMQRDAGDGDTAREGFVGLFSYKDLEIGEDGSIKLTLVERVQ